VALAERGQEDLLDQIVDIRLAAEQAQPDPSDVWGEALKQGVVGLGQDVLGLHGAIDEL
jgi:hypothetical protein